MCSRCFARIPIDAIAGTGVGAIIGGLAGYIPAEIEVLFRMNDLFSDTAVRPDFGAVEDRRPLVYFSSGFDFQG